MSANLTRFLGDTPFRVFIRLLVLSFIVGLVLATLEIHPFQVLSWLERVTRRIWEMGFEAFVLRAGPLASLAASKSFWVAGSIKRNS